MADENGFRFQPAGHPIYDCSGMSGFSGSGYGHQRSEQPGGPHRFDSGNLNANSLHIPIEPPGWLAGRWILGRDWDEPNTLNFVDDNHLQLAAVAYAEASHSMNIFEEYAAIANACVHRMDGQKETSLRKFFEKKNNETYSAAYGKDRFNNFLRRYPFGWKHIDPMEQRAMFLAMYAANNALAHWGHYIPMALIFGKDWISKNV